jgi:hypothetical protein
MRMRSRKSSIAVALCLMWLACCADAPMSERGFAHALDPEEGNVPVDGILILSVFEGQCDHVPATADEFVSCFPDAVSSPEQVTTSWDVFESSMEYSPEYAGGAVDGQSVNFMVAMRPYLAAGLGSAAVDGPLPIGDLVGLGVVVVGTAVYAIQARHQIAASLSSLVGLLRSQALPGTKEGSVANAVADTVDQTRARTDPCLNLPSVPKTVAPGGTVTVNFCATGPQSQVQSDTSAILVPGGESGTVIHVVVNSAPAPVYATVMTGRGPSAGEPAVSLRSGPTPFAADLILEPGVPSTIHGTAGYIPLGRYVGVFAR